MRSRHWLVATLSGVVLVGLLPGLADAGTSARAAGAAPATPTIVATPARPVAKELITVRTTFSRSPRRPGALERRTATGWSLVTRVTSDAAGTFRPTTRPTADTTYRVRVLSGPQKNRLSKLVRVTPLPDSMNIALTGFRTKATASGLASAVRKDRPVALDRETPGGWIEVGITSEKSDGTVSLALTGLTQDEVTYRWRFPAWKGVPERTSTQTAFAPGLVPPQFSLPVMRIDTADAAPIVDRENYLPGTMTLDGTTHALQIRGRGNYTWVNPKKPYRIKLGTKASLLGMPAEKDWALLANFGDRTLVRNTIALDLGAKLTAMPWTPRHRPVEVMLNGQYVGAYDLVEQMETSDQRSAKSRLLLEFDDHYAGQEPTTVRTPVEGLAVTFKDPNPEDVPQSTKDTLLAELGTFETALYSPDFQADGHSYTEYVDVDSFVDYFIGAEIMKSIDADCRTSCFFTWAAGEPIRMGPMWDYDHSAGYDDFGPRVSSPEGWWAADPEPAPGYAHHSTHWLARMRQDPAFQAKVRVR
ncbi:MAG: hypothetical protein EON52_07570, partial [Actinomycetales bacterium]